MAPSMARDVGRGGVRSSGVDERHPEDSARYLIDASKRGENNGVGEAMVRGEMTWRPSAYVVSMHL